METLPREVTSVSKYEIEPFKQGRRVGCYFLGRTLGEGSFAKVKEGLHIITGEKVRMTMTQYKTSINSLSLEASTFVFRTLN